MRKYEEEKLRGVLIFLQWHSDYCILSSQRIKHFRKKRFLRPIISSNHFHGSTNMLINLEYVYLRQGMFHAQSKPGMLSVCL